MNENTTPDAAAVPQAAPKKKKKSNLSTIILVAILILGVGIMAYPTVSNWWNSFHQTRVIANYASTVERVDQAEIDAMIDAAREYNASLLQKDNPFRMTDEDLARYNSLLDLSGTGIMGYVQIKAIGVDIPIYHGTEESVLQTSVGHIDWTSLPVGGESTHAVVSGHRGLPRAKLFTDLDQLKEGDVFTVTVLNQVISYEIDQIRIVEPSDVSELTITPGEDYCTLVTCTPYGINTHRLLLRGHRIANEGGELVVAPEAYRIPNYITIPAVGIPLLFLFLLGMLIYYRRRRPRIADPDTVIITENDKN
ncbi:MAG: class C sortase [Oscillospiraceae bacterium]|nr:class C sortase [Oscillospiraceae bacterium]